MLSDDPILNRTAEAAKALAHPHRLAILAVTSGADLSVDEIAESTGLTVANASQHLQQLRRAGVLASRREGKRVFYALADQSVFSALAALSTLGMATPDEGGVERVGAARLREMLSEGNVALLDVRGANEFAAGHIEGAIQINPEGLDDQLNHLPKNRRLVAYCSGPLCVFALEVAQHLRTSGYDVKVMLGGIAEWASIGGPILQSTSAVKQTSVGN